MIRDYIPQGINAGEIRPQDAVMIEIQETLAEVYETLDKGWNVLKQAAKENEDSQMQSIAKQQQQKIEAMREDREDKQRHDASIKTLEGVIDLGKDSMAAMNEYTLNSQVQQAEQQMMQPAGQV